MEESGLEAIRRRIGWRWYRWGWIGFGAMLVCIGGGYIIGTKAAVNNLFDAWMVAAGIPATLHMVRYRDHRLPGAIPALVMWVAWFAAAIVLGGMVFGSACPSIQVPQLNTPGVR